MAALIIDLETETKPGVNVISLPYDPDLWIVAIGMSKTSDSETFKQKGKYFRSKEESEAYQFKIPADVDLLVGHNIGYDLQWLWEKWPEEIEAFFRRGGQIFDTSLAEYLLSGFRETMPKLTDVAPKYGGTLKVDAVGALWKAGVRTSEIDKSLLYDEYLMSTDYDTGLGDIENTRRVFWGQVKRLQEEGMWDNAMARMGGLVFNVMAMRSGLHVDMDVARTHIKELQEEQQKLDQRVQEAFQSLVPAGASVKRTDYGLSSLIFGGYYDYEAPVPRTDSEGNLIRVKAPMWQTKAGQFYPCQDAPEGLDYVRYASGKNKGERKIFMVETEEVQTKKGVLATQLKGLVNRSRLDPEVREKIEDGIGKRTFKDGTPVLPVGREILEMVAASSAVPEASKPVLKALVRLSEINKDLGTYYIKETEVKTKNGVAIKVSGALQYLQEGNLLHHELNTTQTVTGRLSSSRPNLQNLPRDGTSRVKQMFTSRFNDPIWLGYALGRKEISQQTYDYCMDGLKAGKPVGRIIEIDYTSLEVVTLAYMSHDKNLIKALISGADMHCLRLAKKLGEKYEDVLLKCKDDNHPEHKKYKQMRTDIKPPAFAYQYGATEYGIARSAGMSVEAAKKFIDDEKALFPGVERWFNNDVFPKVQASTWSERRMGEDDKYYTETFGEWRAPSGTRYTFKKELKTVWKDGQKLNTLQFKPTQMRNYMIQGESSFFVQTMAGDVAYAIINKPKWKGKVYLINQVHDALYVDCIDRAVNAVVKLVKGTMERIPERFEPFGYKPVVPFPAAAEAGLDMFTKHEIHV